MGLSMRIERSIDTAAAIVEISVTPNAGWAQLPPIPEPSEDPDAPRINRIVVQEVSWHKAYPIHRWFIQNVQGGANDGADYYLTEEHLTDLRDLCRSMLDGRDHTPLLPEATGEAADPKFWSDVAHTADSLDRILASWDPSYQDYIYSSDW